MRPLALVSLLSLGSLLVASAALARAEDDRVEDPADLPDPAADVEPAPEPADPAEPDVVEPQELVEPPEPPAVEAPAPIPDAVEDPSATRSFDPADFGVDPADLDAVELPPASGVEESPARESLVCPQGTTRKETGREVFCVDAQHRRHGPWLRLHPSGQAAARGQYASGARHGEFLRWYPSGRLEERTRYVDGREEGVREVWYESGQKRSETEVRGGEPHGRQTLWHERGQKQAEGSFHRGERDGTWTWYDEHGRVVRTADFRAGARLAPEAPAGDPSHEPDRGAAALGGAIGAGAGVLVGVPATLAILRLRLLAGLDPEGWLVGLFVPPLVVGLGAGIALAFFTPLPAAALGAAASGLALPIGGAGGLVLGGVVGLLLGAVVEALAPAGGNVLTLFLLGGAAVGGVAGTVALPAALSAGVGWMFAEPEAE